jgi:hypothetical protein
MALERTPRGAHSGGTCGRGTRGGALGSDSDNNQGTAPRAGDPVPVQPVSGLPTILELAGDDQEAVVGSNPPMQP